MNRVSAIARKNVAVPCGIKVGRRGAPRLRLAVPGRLISRYDTRRCIIIDLSRTGARISLERPLAKGEDAVLEIAGLEPFGSVVRCNIGEYGGTNGIAFDAPLEEGEVLDVRSFSERYKEDEARALRQEARRWVTGT